MHEKVLIVAPHPDDEILGVGGTLMRRKAEGAKLAWVVVTSISEAGGWSGTDVRRRAGEIERIRELVGFDELFALDFQTTQLDHVPMSDLVAKIAHAFRSFGPEEVFVPHPSDIHTDHRAAFTAAVSCTKWFRCPSVRRVLAYETLSETDFGISIEGGFRPNVFIDIEPYLETKLRCMDVYASELGPFPFPRSSEAIRSLAAVRGAASGFKAAEAFELLRERL